ncbi:carbonic anhydrase [Tricladium varicosporioides]|nr:carbonic anhydrase [Hymenoscyphus varicosporioides]
MAMPNEDPFPSMLQSAENYAITHKPIPTLEEMKASMPGPPPPVVVILSCCDPRVLPEKIFGGIGMKASEIRNAGGRAGPALRSILCLDHLVGVGTVVVIHHTDCGLTHLRNDRIRDSLAGKAPNRVNEISRIDFGEILDLKGSVVEDMKLLKESPYLSKDLKVVGYVYDIKTGKLEEVRT